MEASGKHYGGYFLFLYYSVSHSNSGQPYLERCLSAAWTEADGFCGREDKESWKLLNVTPEEGQSLA